jgi:DNA-binding LacI/PurR family transcriptional regulator
VARLAEVHKATVSRALNAQTRSQVNVETLKRVKKAARQLGYVPNAVARGLRTSKSMTIGVIIPDLMNPIFPPIVRGVEHVLQAEGYRPTPTHTTTSRSRRSSHYYLVALGLIRRMRAEGLRCPDDVSVLGFNGMPFAEDFWPPLTTVHMPLREIGAEAAGLLLRGIEAGRQERATMTLPVSLVVRGSTGPAPS